MCLIHGPARKPSMGVIFMKVVILAGGFGTRISEESHLRPKPMIEIGEMPILWHIMKIYSHFGFNDFIICLGYKGNVIKEFFANYYLHGSDVTFDFENRNNFFVHSNCSEPWKVTLVNTGIDTMTGGRIRRIRKYLGDETFMLTYGDGVADVNIGSLLEFHRRHGKTVTVTAVQPAGRFGSLQIEGDAEVRGFQEKPEGDLAWINGGFFVLEPDVFDYIDGDSTVFEREPLQAIAAAKGFAAYKHRGFWHAMDTMRDKKYLEELWNDGKAPWRVWQ